MSSLPVEIHATLDCVVDGKAFSVRSTGRQTVVEVPDVATGLRLVRLGSPRGYFWKSVHHWKCFFDSAVHQVEFRVGGQTVGVIGYGVGSRVWNLLGLPKIALKPVVIGSLLLSGPRHSRTNAEG